MKTVINNTNHNWYIKSEYEGYLYDSYGHLLPKEFIKNLDNHKIEFIQDKKQYLLRFYKVETTEKENQIIISEKLEGSYLYNFLDKKFITEKSYTELFNIEFNNYEGLIIFISNVLLNEIDSKDLLITNPPILKGNYQFKSLLKWIEYGQLELIKDLFNKKYYGTLLSLLLYSSYKQRFEEKYNKKFLKITEYMEENFNLLYDFNYQIYFINGIIDCINVYNNDEIDEILNFISFLLDINKKVKTKSLSNEIVKIFEHLSDIKKLLPDLSLKEKIKYVLDNIPEIKLEKFPTSCVDKILQYWIDYILLVKPKDPYKENIVETYKKEIRNLGRVPIDFELIYHKTIPKYKKYKEKDGIYEIYLPDSLVFLRELDKESKRDDYQRMINSNNNQSVIVLFKKDDKILFTILINDNRIFPECYYKNRLNQEDLEFFNQWCKKHDLKFS